MLSGARALPLLQSLGIPVSEIDGVHNYPETAIRQLIEGTPRRVTLGSTPEQIRAAFALCKQYSSACQLSWYGDEGLRNVTLEPFESDLTGELQIRAVPQGSQALQADEDHELELDPDADDPPDVLTGDQLDLGAYVVEDLSLAIDPFPRTVCRSQ